MPQQLRGMDYLDWMTKADGDRDAASLEYLQRNHPDIACYHVQQAMERYLKAQLVSFGAELDKTHGISTLLDDPTMVMGAGFPQDLRRQRVADYAVNYR